MKSILYLLAATPVVYASVLFERQGCPGNNCNRAVTATNSVSLRVSIDCVSFQKATAYPSAVTTTITSGTVSSFVPAGMQQTTISPSAVPAYAQVACASGGAISSRYASACVCAGVAKSTSTAPVPTATQYVPTPDQETPSSPIVCDNPGNVFMGVVNYCTANKNCICTPTISRGSVCVAAGGLSCKTECATDADCESGYCTRNSYCGPPVCIDTKDLVSCANGATSVRLVRRGNES